jgi:DNA-binding MarR family transcriptional regulator
LYTKENREEFMPQYEDCIIFLLAKAYQKAHSSFKQRLAPFNITPVQQLILAVLEEEEFLSPGEIAERVAMDNATLSGVLDRMSEAGMIRKEGNPEDRRSLRVLLTPKAKKLREDLAAQRRAINEEITGRLSLEEKLLLKRMLRDLKG